MGIDPGTRVLGYGVIDGSGSRISHVDSGVISTNPGIPLPERLKKIYDGLLLVIDRHHPEVLSIEDLFYHRNVKSALSLGHARGVAMLAGTNRGLEVFEYSATAIKTAVVGYGRAEKGQIQQMVKVLLNLSAVPQPDAADALAAAICHYNSTGATKSLRTSAGAR